MKKWLVIFMAIVLCFGCACNKGGDPSYGTVNLENGAIYEGELTDGKATGKGKITYTTGAVYEGEVLNGKEHGEGVTTWSNGDSLDGIYENGEAISGRLSYAAGTYYEGEFRSFAPSGQGTMVWPQYNNNTLTGEFYEGFAVNNAARLTYYDADGEVVSYYEGEFSANAPDGEGVMTWANGTVGEGTFAASLIVEGKMKYANGDVFEGEFQANMPKNGTMKYAEGEPRIYTGEFRNTLPNGEGVMVYYTDDTFTTEARREEGYFLNGALDPSGGPDDYIGGVYAGDRYEITGQYGIIQYRYSKDYLGEVKLENDQVVAEGLGKMRFSDGSFIVGEFADNAPEFGGLINYGENGVSVLYGSFFNNKLGGENSVIIFENKDVYVGETFENKPHGIGTIFMWDKNKVYFGEFQNGALTGQGILSEYAEPRFSGSVTEKKGAFVNGVYQEDSEFTLSQENVCGFVDYGGDYFIGAVNEGTPDGVGVLCWQNGNFGVGSFSSGEFTHGILSYTNDKAVYYGDIVASAPKGEHALFAYNPESDTPVAIGKVDGVPKGGVFIYITNPRLILAETWDGDHPASGTMIYFDLGNFVISSENSDWHW